MALKVATLKTEIADPLEALTGDFQDDHTSPKNRGKMEGQWGAATSITPARPNSLRPVIKNPAQEGAIHGPAV